MVSLLNRFNPGAGAAAWGLLNRFKSIYGSDRLRPGRNSLSPPGVAAICLK